VRGPQLNGQTLMSFVLPNELPVEIYELLRQCLDYTQQTRPSFEIIKDRLKEYLENNQLPIMKVEDDAIPDSYICPITFAPMIDPVMCADGHTYERKAIEDWLQNHDTSPTTNEPLVSKHLFLLVLISFITSYCSFTNKSELTKIFCEFINCLFSLKRLLSQF
jgi:hypothetical protein